MRVLTRLYNAKRIVFQDPPSISVIVVVYDMKREAPRTLESLSLRFQKDISGADYEVVVVDNGSPEPLGEEVVSKFGRNFKYVYIENALPSPAAAVNEGFLHCRGDIIGVFIDGARLASPGLLARVMVASRFHPEPVVATLGWHLGPDQQQVSILNGYDKTREDGLLKGIGWPDCGYRLFEVSTFAGSSKNGFFIMPAESNAVFVTRRMFQSVNGFDVRFDAPGGGVVNFDFFHRVVSHPDSALIILLGEGTFHQLHGGISTNADPVKGRERIKQWLNQYKKIRKTAWRPPRKPALYLGPVRPEVGSHMELSMLRINEAHGKVATMQPAIGSDPSPETAMDFLCIGAYRCGMSWLKMTLESHPQVSLAGESGSVSAGGKPRLSRPETLTSDAPWFPDGAGKVRGEVDPAYGILDADEVEYIHSRHPRLKLIYIIRNPLSRAWSHAQLDAARELEDFASLDPNVGTETWLARHVRSQFSVLHGDYERCLRNWLRFYPRQSVLILKYEDVHADPGGAIRQCCKHLGIDDRIHAAVNLRGQGENMPGLDAGNPPSGVIASLWEIYGPRIRDLSEFLGEDLSAAWGELPAAGWVSDGTRPG